MPLVIEGVMSSRSRNLMADLALLRKEKLATDTRILVVDNKGVASDPILVHSLVLAAASPVLASVLASSGESSEGFTIILPGMERGMVEREMDRMYDGDLDLDLLTHLGLLMDVKEEVRESKETGKIPKDSVPDRKVSVVNYSQEYELEDSNDLPLEDNGGQEDIDNDSEYFGAISLKDDFNEDDKHSTGEDDGMYEPGELVNKSKCPHCRRVFSKKEWLDAHIQRVHIRSTCEICGNVFRSGSLLAAHIDRKHSTKQFYCDHCEYSSSLKRDLKYHMKSKHATVTYTCEHCGKAYKNKNILAIHVKEKHDDVHSLLQICDQCDFTCTGPFSQLQVHISIAHCSTKLICTFCTFVTASSSEMNDHKEENHKDQNIQLSPQKMNYVKRKEREALLDHICHICNVKKKSRQALSAHIKRDHEGVKFQCPEEGCNVSKATKTQIKAHVDVVHKGIRHKCETCGKLTTSEGNLKNHMIKKHNVEMFACNKCSVRCWSSERMKNHMLIHQ